MRRRLVDSQGLPRWTTERSKPADGEIFREAVFDGDGNTVGHIAYLRIQHTYGWRPCGTRFGLGTRVEAIGRLKETAA
jgi:hypothetical protein